MKIIPAPVLAGLTVFVAVSILRDLREILPNGAPVLAMLLGALAFFGWHSNRMKFVSVDGDNLYVSGWFKADVIPFANIQYVHSSPGIGLVIVRLRSPSAFGGTIAFMPTWANAFLAAFGQHSIVEELREMAKNASNRSANAT